MLAGNMTHETTILDYFQLFNPPVNIMNVTANKTYTFYAYVRNQTLPTTASCFKQWKNTTPEEMYILSSAHFFMV
jgi:hypothetical protein